MGYKTTFVGFIKSKSGTIEGNKHYFDGWSVDMLDDKFILEYIAAQQGGGTRKAEITKEEYELCINKKLGLLDLVGKYQL